MQLTDVVYADRSERAKLRFVGPQAGWFLHQVLTQSIEDMQAGEARDAALLTVHGRMIGYLELLFTGDAYLAHFEPELRDVLADELARYVFATQVQIEDVTDQHALVVVAGTDARAVAEKAAEGRPVQDAYSLGVPAAYIWTEADDRERLVRALDDLGVRRSSESELETLRIANGIARWGRDMDAKTIALEAGIDSRAISYDKGCYPGQEAVAKIHFRGRVNRTLRRIRLEDAARPGAEVLHESRPAGRLTSVAGRYALGMLKHTIEPGAVVEIEGRSAEVVG